MKAELTDAVRVQIGVYKPKVEIIQRVVCDYFGIEVSRSKEHNRFGESIRARQRIHYLCREFIPNCPLAVLGMITGNGIPFDHATISHSHHQILKQLEFKNRKGERVYPELLIEINKLRRLVIAEFEKQRMGTASVCVHCGNPIIILD